ncbi:MAG: hypothetical protein KGI29_08440 [Pseudomonadota bacterium]|nr:hypothetical protein [Pseudomonadota bacterium]MDE3037980.1 hypothetical protein [Pseudomonadota bacterium]
MNAAEKNTHLPILFRQDRRFFFGILALVSLINIAPMVMFHVGGDVFAHIALNDCFSTQFWQGDLYPRWCLAGNAGLGAPFFLFYFPLPYYVLALLHPLEWLGVSPYGLLTLSCLLATFLTACACYSWLKDMVAPGYALIAAALLLFMPYRMEMLLGRFAYAELWSMAWLPLIFKYTRRLCLDDKNAILPLAAAFALMLLSHVPCAIVGVIGSGAYLILMTGGAWLPKWRYGLSLLWGSLMVAFYLVPGAYYARFVHVENIDKTWSNVFPSLQTITHFGLWRPAIMIAVMIAATGLFIIHMLLHRRRIADGFTQHELFAWAAIAVLALFLFLPVSAPAYALLGRLSRFVFPWRMQAIFALCATFMLAQWMQYLAPLRRRDTWAADMAALGALLTLLAYFQLTIYQGGKNGRFAVLAAADVETDPQYQPTWSDRKHFNAVYVLDRYNRRGSRSEAMAISGTGQVEVARWAWDGIALATQASNIMTVRLNQLYFPVWRAQMERGAPAILYPEPRSGQMLVDVPPGRHYITLTYAVSHAAPWLVRIANLASIAAVLLWLEKYYRAGSCVLTSRLSPVRAGGKYNKKIKKILSCNIVVI